MNSEKAFLEAQSALFKARVDSEKQQFPGFGDNFGKSGASSFEAAGRDKFHVTAKTAGAYQIAAKELAKILLGEQEASVLLTEADRNSVPAYLNESTRLTRIGLEVRQLLGASLAPEASGSAALIGVGSLLSELAQVTKLFRTDKNVSFSDVDLPDELLTDLIAVEAGAKVIYPSAYVDSLLDGSYATTFAQGLKQILSRRSELLKLTGANKAKADVVLTEINQWASQLTAPDATTKLPLLLTVLRGEVVSGAIKGVSGRTLNIKVLAEGGSSLKTSSIWRSDRLYASGGVVVSYTIAKGGTAPAIIKAGLITSETPFQRIPLK
jgi:hypothetical protein